jgi:thymidylate synthase (FAD)
MFFYTLFLLFALGFVPLLSLWRWCRKEKIVYRYTPVEKKDNSTIFSIMPEPIPLYNEGFVRLVRLTPDICPEGRGADFAIVQCARVSYGQGLKSKEADDKLVRYLITNRHTSPLESVQFTFHLRLPMFVAIHLLRHRTAKVNMFSQRYAEIDEKEEFFCPSKECKGIRMQDEINKQGSVLREQDEKVNTLVKETENMLSKIKENYHTLIDNGVAKEVARFALPMSTYTEMYYTLDLNNFIKFISLRNDPHAQYETQLCAKAMLQLVKPYIPTVIEALGWSDK